MKKRVGWIVVMAMFLLGAACGTGKDKNNSPTRLGTSDFFIDLPEGYAQEEDEWEEDQVAYYYKDDESIDFDVYQWAKEGMYTLESEAQYFAEEYGVTPEKITINGLEAMKYVTQEEHEGYIYTVLNYMLDDGEDIVKVCFWTINTPEEIAATEAIIGSITMEQ